MKTTVVTTIHNQSLGSLAKTSCIDNQTIWFKYGRTEYRMQGTYYDGSAILVIGRKNKEYKVFDALKNALKDVETRITTVVTAEQTGVDEIELVSPRGQRYSFKDIPLKAKDMQVGRLYADMFYQGAGILELVKKTDTNLEFKDVYGNHYGPVALFSNDNSDWYAVNEPDEQPAKYVGCSQGSAYYATSTPVTTDNMTVGELYATPANANGEQNVYKLLELADSKYPVMQIQAGPEVFSAKNSGVTTFMNTENEWYKAYKESGSETKIGNYIVTPQKVAQNADSLVFGGLYADINGGNATILQYKGSDHPYHLYMNVIHNGDDYCAKTGEIIVFPADTKGTFNLVKYIG